MSDEIASHSNERNRSEWSDDELYASVDAYLEMQRRTREGQVFTKKSYYDALARRFGRTSKAFEYRMQNISYVLTLLGRGWLAGLKPAQNVGPNNAKRIEKFLSEAEGRPATATAEFELAVHELRGKQSASPSGTAHPRMSEASVAVFHRDPAVKAWVLDVAQGACERCGTAAPFLDSSGQPFLEVHHLRRLADGGSDRVTNAVALCPNCHRALHYAGNAQMLSEQIFANVSRLVRE